MPGMNGVETLEGVKSIYPEAVVLMITAYAVDDLIEQATGHFAFSGAGLLR